MEIETKRLKMISCDSESIRLMEDQKYENGPQAANHVKALLDDSSMDGWGSWLVLRKSDGVILGDAGFKGKPNPENQVEIGYGFLESYWGMGYATEAVEGLLDWAFKANVVEKVVAETDRNNSGSIRVLKKAGMEETNELEDMIYWQLIKQR
ncbi:ribosomal-protein-alanine N-acetyltransferase [Planomicrobium stackebrandtii]|uniref:Ribosomal-protein-alanine N-acetyltransferase n=1 Tax=Planomicrobium stackebrandtii TaxID=253160 RepID=A0ABU0GR56_9BACL|nr:GNAT family N-acetyltransferase [Planomicrobium stackebrandtii]MDQ0427523.1 ribosomal-protein-alanine N-acetyltransferase [Planomicrobium stackebrandtii]